MKKVLSFLVAAVLVLSMMTAFAAPSKSHTNLLEITDIKNGDGAAVEGFSIYVTEDSAATTAELQKISTYVGSNGNVIGYFDDDVQKAILDTLNGGDVALTQDDLKTWKMNDYASLALSGTYKDEMGNVIATFKTVTPYAVGQKIAGVLFTFDGTRTEVEPGVYEFNSDKFALAGEVVNTDDTNSYIDVTFTPEAIHSMEKAIASSIAVLSE